MGAGVVLPSKAQTLLRGAGGLQRVRRKAHAATTATWRDTILGRFPATTATRLARRRVKAKSISTALSSLDLSDESLQGSLFAFSLFPYLAFLYYTEKTKQTPRMVYVGFCTLLIFVFVTIPAGLYAKDVYGTSLANVDWLHGPAESFLTLTNAILVYGFRKGIRTEARKQAAKKE